MGDPFFIDTSEESWPVYAAIHGEGPWEPKRVASSLPGFGGVLSLLAELAKGREDPGALAQNPLKESEKHAILAAIGQRNPGINVSFWEDLIGGYLGLDG